MEGFPSDGSKGYYCLLGRMQLVNAATTLMKLYGAQHAVRLFFWWLEAHRASKIGSHSS
jgi:hypothetical protein